MNQNRSFCYLLLLMICLSGCSGKTGVAGGAPEVTSSQAKQERDWSSQAKEQETSQVSQTYTETVKEMTESTKAAEQDPNTSIANPMKAVDSCQDFSQVELSLCLPVELEVSEPPSYFIISGQVAEIQFYDQATQSLVSVRAAHKDLGDVSGVYYYFDDSKTQTNTITLASGDPLVITYQGIVDGTDIHGTLATWSLSDTNYFLWMDNGKQYPEQMFTLAAQIAMASE